MNKVYCKNCKYHKYYFPPPGYSRHVCTKIKWKHEDYYDKYEDNGRCELLNKDNDCEAYEKKLTFLKKLIKILRINNAN